MMPDAVELVGIVADAEPTDAAADVAEFADIRSMALASTSCTVVEENLLDTELACVRRRPIPHRTLLRRLLYDRCLVSSNSNSTELPIQCRTSSPLQRTEILPPEPKTLAVQSSISNSMNTRA